MSSIPSVDPTFLAVVDVTAITISSGHSERSRIGRTRVLSPSSASSTNPPKSDRGDEPEHRREISASSSISSGGSRTALTAVTRAAKPDADDANPAAVGNEFSLSTITGGRPGRRRRMRSRQERTRRERSSDAGAPPRISSSRSPSVESSTFVVVVSVSSVIEIEPTAGRLVSTSDLPQYLTRAMFGWATAVKVMNG